MLCQIILGKQCGNVFRPYSSRMVSRRRWFLVVYVVCPASPGNICLSFLYNREEALWNGVPVGWTGRGRHPVWLEGVNQQVVVPLASTSLLPVVFLESVQIFCLMEQPVDCCFWFLLLSPCDDDHDAVQTNGQWASTIKGVFYERFFHSLFHDVTEQLLCFSPGG